MGGPSSSGSAASGLSQLGLVTSVAGGVLTGQANKAADDYKAEMLDQAAQYGELSATQTNAQMTRNLAITLGHIDAVRAAARGDPTSPTGAAVRDFTEETGTEEKNIKVDSIMAQAQMDEENAAYLRSAGSDALLGGIIGGIGQGIGSISKAIPT